MNERFPGGRTHESAQELEYSIEHDEREIEDYLQFANEAYGLEKLDTPEKAEINDETVMRWRADFIAAHADRIALFVAHDAKGKIAGGGLVTLLDEEEKRSTGLGASAFRNATIAVLEYQAVRGENRQQGIGKELTDKRIAWAKGKGAQVILTDIETTNPVSAHAKARDGFLFVDFMTDHLSPVPFLVAVKPAIEGEPYGPPLPAGYHYAQKTLTLDENSYDEAHKLFSEGWVGVDASIPDDQEHIVLRLERAERTGDAEA